MTTKATIRWYLGELQEQINNLDLDHQVPVGDWNEDVWRKQLQVFRERLFHLAGAEQERLNKRYNTTKADINVLLESDKIVAQQQSEIALFLAKKTVGEQQLYCHSKGKSWKEEQLEKEVKYQIRWQFKMLELMTLLPPKKQGLFSWSETISSEEIQQQIRKIRSLYNQRSVISKWWRPSYALLAKHVARKNSLHHFNWHTHWKNAQSKSLLETTRLRKLQRAWTWKPVERPCPFYRFLPLADRGVEITMTPISNKMYTFITKQTTLGTFNTPATVSWTDAIVFCNMLSKRESLEAVYDIKPSHKVDDLLGQIEHFVVIQHLERNGYRLPTCEEWLLIATELNQKPMPKYLSQAIYKPEDFSDLAKVKRRTSPFIRELPRVQISTLQGAPDEEEFINFSFVDDSLVPTIPIEHEFEEKEEEEITSLYALGKQPNRLGFTDTWTNGWEWCTDRKNDRQAVVGLGFEKYTTPTPEERSICYPQDISWVPPWTQDNCIGFRVLRTKTNNHTK